MKILNFGSLNIDYTYRVDSFVSAGETISASEMSRNIGGKGLNQSIALARAGAEVYHAGQIGVDGMFLTDYLKENGVNTDNVKISDIPTGHAVIQLDKSGQNCIMIYGGANTAISTKHIDTVLEGFGSGDVLLMQNEINNGKYIITEAHRKGMITVLNPSPLTNLDISLDLVDYFLLNETEAAGLFGSEDINEIISAMRKDYPKAKFVLTLGGNGAIYIDLERIIKADAVKTDVKDTTAAGDTFTGFFLTSLFNGDDPQKALQTASKAASVAVSRIGAAQTIPYMNEI